jgi:peptide/nickel transport system permease protein
MSAVALAPADTDADPVDPPQTQSRRRRAPVLLTIAFVWLGVVVGAAIFADVLPLKPYDVPIGRARTGLGWRSEFFGYDAIGRSVLSRVVYGARVSLFVGLMAVAISLVLGGLLGLLAAYFRGWVDAIVSVVVNSMLAFPALVLLLALTSVLSPSIRTLVLALSVLGVPSFARLSRAATMTFLEREFIRAARAMGATHRRVLFRELLPNVLPGVLSYAFLVVAGVIVAEGSLSFLGLGIPPPQPSWGGMIASGRPALAEHPALVFVPAGVMMLTVLALNVVGDYARRRFGARDTVI